METTKPRQTRRRLNEQTWRALMKKFDGARMTPQEFCECEGLSRKSFARWRSRLVLAPRRGSSAVPALTAANPVAAKTPFVDLGLLGVDAGGAHGTLDLRIELGGGISLHFVRR
jgi:hypothetical protein